MEQLLILKTRSSFLAAPLAAWLSMAFSLLILKCPYNGPGYPWEKFPLFLPTLHKSVSSHMISYSFETAFHREPACTKVPSAV